MRAHLKLEEEACYLAIVDAAEQAHEHNAVVYVTVMGHVASKKDRLAIASVHPDGSARSYHESMPALERALERYRSKRDEKEI